MRKTNEVIKEQVKKLENGLQKYGIEKIQRIDFSYLTEIEEGKHVLAVEELEWVISCKDGDIMKINYIEDIQVDDEFEDGFYDDEELQNQLYHLGENINDLIKKSLNETYSQDEIILFDSLQRSEQDCFIFE